MLIQYNLCLQQAVVDNPLKFATDVPAPIEFTDLVNSFGE